MTNMALGHGGCLSFDLSRTASFSFISSPFISRSGAGSHTVADSLLHDDAVKVIIFVKKWFVIHFDSNELVKFQGELDVNSVANNFSQSK